jgi:DnaJ-class molecular chaperone
MVRLGDESSKENRPKYKLVTCKVCGGTGVDKSNSFLGVPCETCVGKGKRLFVVGPSQKCPVCQGEGKDSRFSLTGVPCKSCRAFGKIPI